MVLPGGWSFLFPWTLSALMALPALWWLLRLMPPRPRTVVFAPLFLLRGLVPVQQAAARAPWWIVVLRGLILACFIFSFAGPVREAGAPMPGGDGAVLIVVDNGWSAASGWDLRRAKLESLLADMARADRPVALLQTAAEGPVHSVQGPMDPGAARMVAADIVPHPWESDMARTRAAAEEAFTRSSFTHAVFLSDGVEVAGVSPFLDLLHDKTGGLSVVHDSQVNAPLILKSVGDGRSKELSFDAVRLPGRGAMPARLTAYDEEGTVIDRHDFSFLPGAATMHVDWSLVPEARARIDRVELRAAEGGGAAPSAAAVFLSGGRWRPRPVGIIGDMARSESAGVLDEVYTLRRALEDGGVPVVAPLTELLNKKLSVIIWPDSAGVTPAEREKLEAWVRAGGLLLRFAGPALAAEPEDKLLPVVLRGGARAFDGAMTWEKPLKIGAAVDEGPLRGLAPPSDVTIWRQVLAEPSPATFDHTWLRLEDGTPFVTGAALGAGTIALVHTTAGPAWSDFCHAGLYVEVLRRVIAQATGVAGDPGRATLPPLSLLDGFGRARTPGEGAQGVDPSSAFTPDFKTPPGLYGDSGTVYPANLGAALRGIDPLDSLPFGAREESYGPVHAQDLRPLLAMTGVFLLLFDTVLTLWLRGVFALRQARIFVFLLLFAPTLAQAEDTVPASGLSLVYIETGDEAADRLSRAGLEALSLALKMRTTVRIRDVRGVDPADPDLAFYPVVYWPMTSAQGPLSAGAARNMQNYMADGGMVLLDTRDGAAQGTGHEILRDVSRSLRIPALAPVGTEHILFRSFYLLRDASCRLSGAPLWAEKEPDRTLDGMTSVIVSGNDCAAAWAGEDVDPRAREMSLRLGINIVMAALTGNYKADQVHVPHILERLGR